MEKPRACEKEKHEKKESHDKSQETWYKILMGQADNNNWDESLSQMETMGVQEYIDIYQTC